MVAIVVASSLFHGDAERVAVAFAAVGAAGVLAFSRVPGPSLFMPIGLALGFATLRAYILIDERTRWEYTPFVNTESAVALAVVAAWVYLSVTVPRGIAAIAPERKAWEPESPANALAMIGPVMVFLWIRGELAEAFSRDMATFLLIFFYALAGVGTILVGRKRGVDGLRQAGLALSLYAAGKAVVGASELASIGLQVGSYLVVGVFFLGVGYLYRAAPQEESEAAA
jgi:hypothetical protein